MRSESEQSHIDNLLTLIKENPELPIVPKVDSDVVADYGYSYWLGGWGKAEVDYMINGMSSDYLDEERVYFKSEDDEEIEQLISDELHSQGMIPESYIEIRIQSEFEAIEWQKVIAVSITLPE